jgi:hypothetical protein
MIIIWKFVLLPKLIPDNMFGKEYTASLSITNKAITFATMLIFAGLTYLALDKIIHAPDNTDKLLASLVLAGLLLILLITYSFSPRKYSIWQGELIIHRLIGSVRIPLTDIAEVRKIDKGDLRGSIRTFGVGGLFGNFGKFYNRKFGRMTFFVTQNKNLLLIFTKKGKKIVLSPDDATMAERLLEHK